MSLLLYLLLSLYAGAALRFSTPAIRWFIPLWTEKANPFRTAHIVPVRKGPLLELFPFSRKINEKKCNNQKGDLPLRTNHGAESFRAFECVGKVDPATVFTRQLGFLLFLCEKGNGRRDRDRQQISFSSEMRHSLIYSVHITAMAKIKT